MNKKQRQHINRMIKRIESGSGTDPDSCMDRAARLLEQAEKELRLALAAGHRRGCSCNLCRDPDAHWMVTGMAWHCKVGAEMLGSVGAFYHPEVYGLKAAPIVVGGTR